jgi:hypothetical protein
MEETFLKLQGQEELQVLFEKSRSQVKKILKSHPQKSHGFFLSQSLQGYIILETDVNPYSTIGSTFHVRPVMEEILVNPEFMLVNISLYDIKVFKGDFHHLEIFQHYEFDQLTTTLDSSMHPRVYVPQHMGLIPYKSILAMKTIARKLMDMILYHSFPVVVTGLEEMKTIFLRYFEHSFGVISFKEDFYEKSCMEIMSKSKVFRPAVMDFYSAQLKERLKRMMKSKRLLTELDAIIRATMEGKIIHLVLPTEKKLWGTINLETGEFEIHTKVQKVSTVDILNELAEEVMKQGGKIQVLGPHFFPVDTHAFAVLKG